MPATWSWGHPVIYIQAKSSPRERTHLLLGKNGWQPSWLNLDQHRPRALGQKFTLWTDHQSLTWLRAARTRNSNTRCGGPEVSAFPNEYSTCSWLGKMRKRREQESINSAGITNLPKRKGHSNLFPYLNNGAPLEARDRRCEKSWVVVILGKGLLAVSCTNVWRSFKKNQHRWWKSQMTVRSGLLEGRPESVRSHDSGTHS